jgi:hypothetical protein
MNFQVLTLTVRLFALGGCLVGCGHSEPGVDSNGTSGGGATSKFGGAGGSGGILGNSGGAGDSGGIQGNSGGAGGSGGILGNSGGATSLGTKDGTAIAGGGTANHSSAGGAGTVNSTNGGSTASSSDLAEVSSLCHARCTKEASLNCAASAVAGMSVEVCESSCLYFAQSHSACVSQFTDSLKCIVGVPSSDWHCDANRGPQLSVGTCNAADAAVMECQSKT